MRIRVSIEQELPNKGLVYQSEVEDFDWMEMKPVLPSFSDPWQMQRFQESNEKRKRFVDHLSGNIASALTQALWDGTTK